MLGFASRPPWQTVIMLIPFILSFLLSFAATPLAKKIAEAVGAVDEPNERRINKVAMPRMGGAAIFLGFFVSVLLTFAVGIFFVNKQTGVTEPIHIDSEIWGILIGTVIITAMGILDDVFQLNARIKLIIQVVAAIVTVFFGVKIEGLSVGQHWIALPEVVAILLSIGWIVLVTNAVNLIDGLDGLAAGVSSISSVAVLCIAILASELNVAIMTAALAGACLGFLPYNLNPAKIFMGDTGSNMLGFVLATVSIQGIFKGYAIISFVIPFLILGLPIFDTGFAIIRRLVHHKPLMQADRGHFHHRLLDAGFSQKRAVGILYSICLALCVLAVLLVVVILSTAR